MRIIQTNVEPAVSQSIKKCRVILERTSHANPNCFGFHVILREFGNQNVKGVRDSAALIMHDLIVAADRCPNQAFAQESWIDNRISRVPLLTWLCDLAAQTVTIAGGKSP